MDFEQDAQEKTAPSNDQLNAISTLAKEQARRERVLKNAEEAAKEARRQYEEIALRKLPEALEEAGVQKFTTTDGYTVEVEEKLYASVPKKNKEVAAQWLVDNGHGSLVSADVVVPFDKGQQEAQERVLHLLNEAGITRVKQDTSFHTGQLKSLIQELQAEGQEVPLDLFGAYWRRQAKVSE